MLLSRGAAVAQAPHRRYTATLRLHATQSLRKKDTHTRGSRDQPTWRLFVEPMRRLIWTRRRVRDSTAGKKSRYRPSFSASKREDRRTLQSRLYEGSLPI